MRSTRTSPAKAGALALLGAGSLGLTGCSQSSTLLSTLAALVAAALTGTSLTTNTNGNSLLTNTSSTNYTATNTTDPRNTIGTNDPDRTADIPGFDTTTGALDGAVKFETTLGVDLYLPESYRGGAARLVLRGEWDSNPPTSAWARYTDRAPRSITIHHTVSPTDAAVKIAKDYHQNDRGWIDIAYHFLIRDDGTIYEGRPLGVRGDHSGPNAGRIGVCLIGSFDKHDFQAAQFEGARTSLEHLLRALHHAFPATRGRIRPHGVEKQRSVGTGKVCPGPSVEAWGTAKGLWEAGYQPGTTTRAYRPDPPLELYDTEFGGDGH